MTMQETKNMLDAIKPMDEYKDLAARMMGVHAPLTSYMLAKDLIYSVESLNITHFTLENESDSVPKVVEETGHSYQPFKLKQIPLPFCHVNFTQVTEREQNHLDAEYALRHVAEKVEGLVLGVEKYNCLEGLLHVATKKHPVPIEPVSRSLYHPDYWLRKAVEQLGGYGHYGPYCLVFSDAGMSGADHDRLKQAAQHRTTDLVISRHLSKDEMILFAARPENARLIVGYRLCVTPWEKGLKALAMIVPQFREDARGCMPVVRIIN